MRWSFVLSWIWNIRTVHLLWTFRCNIAISFMKFGPAWWCHWILKWRLLCEWYGAHASQSWKLYETGECGLSTERRIWTAKSVLRYKCWTCRIIGVRGHMYGLQLTETIYSQQLIILKQSWKVKRNHSSLIVENPKIHYFRHTTNLKLMALKY